MGIWHGQGTTAHSCSRVFQLTRPMSASSLAPEITVDLDAPSSRHITITYFVYSYSRVLSPSYTLTTTSWCGSTATTSTTLRAGMLATITAIGDPDSFVKIASLTTEGRRALRTASPTNATIANTTAAIAMRRTHHLAFPVVMYILIWLVRTSRRVPFAATVLATERIELTQSCRSACVASASHARLVG